MRTGGEGREEEEESGKGAEVRVQRPQPSQLEDCASGMGGRKSRLTSRMMLGHDPHCLSSPSLGTENVSLMFFREDEK